ncbi:exopolyphosphatase [Candidatus Nitromaritima sp. SCGC AAA799-A02]|nr:exopolyphosphatase [Candidatus Nitromaritima sp. SCGC AAA799-A02]
MTRIASIDIGTNTVRMLILETDSTGSLREIGQERVITRLGEGMDTEKRLLERRMQGTLSVLAEFRGKCREYAPVIIRAVATSAVREAGNRDEFLKRAREEAGLEIEVIPWETEARLMIEGVLWQLPDAGKAVLAFDIGGGSTEFILARDREIVQAAGTVLGTVRLTEKFITRHPIVEEEYHALEAHLRHELLAVKEKLSAFAPETLVGTAGTVTTLAAIDGNVYPYDPQKIHGRTLSRQRVEEILEELKGLSLEERVAMQTMEKGREDLIIAGSALALETLRVFDCDPLTVSEYGLREGIALDSMKRA